MLKVALQNLGMKRGDIVLVHSAWDEFRGFSGKPADVITVLEDVIGDDGTLLMPSMPFGGTAIDYVRTGAITDIARTPSRMGLLTEVFRRQPATVRSIHPTHPILARGPHANAITSNHAASKTPCGAGSPFEHLLQANGKVLFLGTTIETMTFFHYLEEKFEDRMPESPFTSEQFRVQVRTGGTTWTVETRLFEPTLSRRRQIKVLVPLLKQWNGLKQSKVGALPLMLVDAAAATKAFETLLDRKESFYVG